MPPLSPAIENSFSTPAEPPVEEPLPQVAEPSTLTPEPEEPSVVVDAPPAHSFREIPQEVTDTSPLLSEPNHIHDQTPYVEPPLDPTPSYDAPRPTYFPTRGTPRIHTTSYADKSFHFVTSTTNSFTELVNLVASVGDNSDILWVDWHYNATPGLTYGPVMFTNKRGKEFGKAFNHNIIHHIYDVHGFKHQGNKVLVRSHYSVLSRGNKYGIAAVISEPFFKKDTKNKETLMKFFMTQDGWDAIAREFITAAVESPFKHIVVSIGHYGWTPRNGRGRSGTSYNGYHEIDFGWDCLEAMKHWMETQEYVSPAELLDADYSANPYADPTYIPPQLILPQPPPAPPK